jgi:hypothetical protein
VSFNESGIGTRLDARRGRVVASGNLGIRSFSSGSSNQSTSPALTTSHLSSLSELNSIDGRGAYRSLDIVDCKHTPLCSSPSSLPSHTTNTLAASHIAAELILPSLSHLGLGACHSIEHRFSSFKLQSPHQPAIPLYPCRRYHYTPVDPVHRNRYYHSRPPTPSYVRPPHNVPHRVTASPKTEIDSTLPITSAQISGFI